MPNSISNCLLCQQTAEEYPGEFPQRSFNCPTCGTFTISESAQNWIYERRRHNPALTFPRLSAFTREQTLRRQEPNSTLQGSLIISDTTHGFLLPGAIPLSEALAAFPHSVSDRLDRFMLNLARMQPKPGQTIEIGPRDYSVAYAEDWATANFFAKQLAEMKWIDYIDRSPNLLGPGTCPLTITVVGWNRIAELQRVPSGQTSTQAFVAMWFNQNKMRDTFETGFEVGIKNAGYDVMRIDRAEHNHKIDDEIIAQIRKSRFLVADFTGQRGGVYFEAGFAMGLGLPIIWTCRRDHLRGLHFDTRQYNHIDWDTPTDLAARLQQRIEATIGRGPAP